jgi:hypothetical protein
MRFTSKQVTTMVVAIAAAVVVMPAGVYAVTSTIVRISDAAGREARVTHDHELLTANRAAVGSSAFNARGSRYQFGWIGLAGTTGPTRIAITEMTLSGPFDVGGTTGAGEVLLEALVRTSGSLPCNGPGTAGYTRHTLKHVWVPIRQTIQLTWAGQPLVLPKAASGQPSCFGVTYYAGSTNMTIYADATGYKFQ